MSETVSIGQAIRERREAAGLGQRALAKAAGVPQSRLSRTEAGDSDPDTAFLEAIADALDCTVGDLFGNTANDAPVTHVPFRELRPSGRNPRSFASVEGINTLAMSISDLGVLEPLIVRKRPDGEYETIAGHRRAQALQLLAENREIGDDYPVPVVVRDFDDRRALLAALTENLAREDMNPMDEADAFHDLVEAGTGTDEIANAVGRTRRYVQARLQLVERLAFDVQMALTQGRIRLAQAEALAQVCDEAGGPDNARQNTLLKRILAGELTTEAEIRETAEPSHKEGLVASWNTDRDQFDIEDDPDNPYGWNENGVAARPERVLFGSHGRWEWAIDVACNDDHWFVGVDWRGPTGGGGSLPRSSSDPYDTKDKAIEMGATQIFSTLRAAAIGEGGYAQSSPGARHQAAEAMRELVDGAEIDVLRNMHERVTLEIMSATMSKPHPSDSDGVPPLPDFLDRTPAANPSTGSGQDANGVREDDDYRITVRIRVFDKTPLERTITSAEPAFRQLCELLGIDVGTVDWMSFNRRF